MSIQGQITSLVQSEGRIRILELLDEEPRRQTDLAANCSISRPSVSRYLADFVDHGWVTREKDVYHLTASGRRILDTYFDMVEDVRFVELYSELLNRMGEHGATIPEKAVKDAEIVHSKPLNLQRAIEYLIDVILSAEPAQLRGVIPMYTPLFKEPLERLLDQAVPAEIHVPANVADEWRASDFYDFDPYSTGIFIITDEPMEFDFGLLIFENQTLLFTKPTEDVGSICLHGRSEELYDWATEVLERQYGT